MQTFRQSFWKASKTPSYIIFIIGWFFFAGLAIHSQSHVADAAWYFLIGWLIFTIPFFFLFPTQYYYLIIDDSSLIFRNQVKRHFRCEFQYRNIDHIHIQYPGGRCSPCIDIHLKGIKRCCRFFIDAIPESSYPQIINLLREKGVEVRTTNLDDMLRRHSPKNRPSRFEGENRTLGCP